MVVALGAPRLGLFANVFRQLQFFECAFPGQSMVKRNGKWQMVRPLDQPEID